MAEYIEREALLAFLEGNHDGRDWLVNQYNADWICSWIESQPAADVVPVVHGRWEEADDGDGVVCSVCREDFCTIYLETERFNYCPNCGAHMREADGNG